MTNFTVTLSDLRKAGACFCGYNRLIRSLQDAPFTKKDDGRDTYIRFAHKDQISIPFILESNGLNDALWALRCVKDADRDIRLYAVWCARQLQHLMTDERSLLALDVAERHANGDASDMELAAAWDAAMDAAGAAAWSAAMAAGSAAWSAAGAAACDAAMAARAAAMASARAAACDEARAAQRDMLLKMCKGEAPWQMSEGVMS